jgi:hypothetical protein
METQAELDRRYVSKVLYCAVVFSWSTFFVGLHW